MGRKLSELENSLSFCKNVILKEHMYCLTDVSITSSCSPSCSVQIIQLNPLYYHTNDLSMLSILDAIHTLEISLCYFVQFTHSGINIFLAVPCNYIEIIINMLTNTLQGDNCCYFYVFSLLESNELLSTIYCPLQNSCVCCNIIAYPLMTITQPIFYLLKEAIPSNSFMIMLLCSPISCTNINTYLQTIQHTATTLSAFCETTYSHNSNATFTSANTTSDTDNKTKTSSQTTNMNKSESKNLSQSITQSLSFNLRKDCAPISTNLSNSNTNSCSQSISHNTGNSDTCNIQQCNTTNKSLCKTKQQVQSSTESYCIKNKEVLQMLHYCNEILEQSSIIRTKNWYSCNMYFLGSNSATNIHAACTTLNLLKKESFSLYNRFTATWWPTNPNFDSLFSCLMSLTPPTFCNCIDENNFCQWFDTTSILNMLSNLM